MSVAAIASSGIQAGFGIGQTVAGVVKKNKAEGLFPTQDDPEERSQLERLDRLRRGYTSGTAISNISDNINKATASASEASLILSGGATGQQLTSLSNIAESGAMANNQLLSQAESYGMQREQLFSQLLQRMSQRRLELNLLKYSSEKANAEGLIEAGMENTLAAVSSATMSGFGGDKPNGTSPSDTSTNARTAEHSSMQKGTSTPESGRGLGSPEGGRSNAYPRTDETQMYNAAQLNGLGG